MKIFEEIKNLEKCECDEICINCAEKYKNIPTATFLNNVVAQSLTTDEIVDMVNKPAHYARYVIEPIDFIVKNKLGFLEGQVLKYVVRHDAKNGLEDLKKAQYYLNLLISLQ